jgi:RNA polymerase sigma factor (sigma-70 family)
MEPWLAKLEEGDADGAWERFLERYRRLIFATIRHYADDYDDVMDVFTQVCEALRADDLAILRRYGSEPSHSARFSTWLVVVVRNQVVDWFRRRDGRRRLSAIAGHLQPLRRAIFEYVFHRSYSHLEAYELIRTDLEIDLSFGAFLAELRETYRDVTRHRRGHVLREMAGPLPEADPELHVEQPEFRSDAAERLQEALNALDPSTRTAVQLFVIEDLPAADVARIVGWPNAKAVYNRVHRALGALRARLEHQGVGRGDL